MYARVVVSDRKPAARLLTCVAGDGGSRGQQAAHALLLMYYIIPPVLSPKNRRSEQRPRNTNSDKRTGTATPTPTTSYRLHRRSLRRRTGATKRGHGGRELLPAFVYYLQTLSQSWISDCILHIFHLLEPSTHMLRGDSRVVGGSCVGGRAWLALA